MGEKVESRVVGKAGMHQDDADRSFSVLGGPTSDPDDCVIDPNSLCQGRGLGGHMCDLTESGVVGSVGMCRDTADGSKGELGCPRVERNERVANPNLLCRAIGPEGHLGKSDMLGDVQGVGRRRSDVDSVGVDGRRCRIDGVTSIARCESKRLETRMLAENARSQRQQYKQTTANIPRSSTPSGNRPRRPTGQSNPPRRRGRLKTNLEMSVRRISTSCVEQSHRGQIWRLKSIGFVVYQPQVL